MEIIGPILELATATIGLITQKDKTRGERLMIEKMELEKKWYEEFNKPKDQRSNLATDLIMRELRILTKTIAATANSMSARGNS